MRLIVTPVFLIVSGIGLIALYRRERMVAWISGLLFGLAYVCSSAAPVGYLLRLWQVPEQVECKQPDSGHMYVVLTGGQRCGPTY